MYARYGWLPLIKSLTKKISNEDRELYEDKEDGSLEITQLKVEGKKLTEIKKNLSNIINKYYKLKLEK